MDELQRRVDSIRRERSELENHVIDEFFSGRISRREFVRLGSVLGLSVPLVSVLVAACGSSSATGAGTSTAGAVKQGGHLTVAIVTPAAAVEPLTVADEGGLVLLGQTGEYLAWSGKDLKLRPVLATGWQANSDGSVWTFKIRQGVAFHDGSPMSADDVVATLNLHLDPANKSNARSVFKGVLSTGGVKAVDSSTVQFTLDAPNGNFPYLVSSDNYNLIILPKNYSGDYQSSFTGTGPWRMTSYNSGSDLQVSRWNGYWDKSNLPPLDSVDWKFYADEQARDLALQGGSVQMVSHFSASGGQALLSASNLTIISAPTAAHRQIHMRVDQEPFTDKRVRQAIALSINRDDIVKGLLAGKAQVANDNPFFKLYPSTDQSVAQRTQNVAMAKQLLSDAGKANGFSVDLYTWKGFEIPDLAQLVQSAAKAIGVTINLHVLDAGTYYDKYWLDSPMGITDYGHRGVPNVYLGAPLLSTGTWNAAHYANPAYDSLVKQYVAATDLSVQRQVAGQIQKLLLDDTPLVIPYNYDFLGASTNTLLNVEITGMGHVNLRQAGYKA